MKLNDKNMEYVRKILLATGEKDMFGIYQLKDTENAQGLLFRPLDSLWHRRMEITSENYNLVYVGFLDEKMTLDLIFRRFNIERPDTFTGHSLSVSDVVVLHRNRMNTAYFVDSVGFKEIPFFFGSEAMAVQIDDRFVGIQRCDNGYDYSIFDENYKLLDGGVYDNQDISLKDVFGEIIKDIQNDSYLKGKVTEKSQVKIIDYEGLMKVTEKAENEETEKNRLSDVINRFKEETDRLFHPIIGMDREFIEEIVKAYLLATIEKYGLNVRIKDIALVGSRSRGKERTDSDLDFVVEFSGDVREDHLFNIFHDDILEIGGVTVDINPITECKTGTLEEYLQRMEKEYINSGIITRESIIAELRNRGYDAQPVEKVKNGVVFEGIAIRNKENISPVIYTEHIIEQAVKEGKKVTEAADIIIKIYEENKEPDIDVKSIMERGFVLSHIYIGLQKESMEDIVKSSCDLDGIESYLYTRWISDNGKEYSIKVCMSMLNMLCITSEEAWETAKVNTNSETVIEKFMHVIAELMGDEYVEDVDSVNSIYIVTNKRKDKGASAVLNQEALKQLSEKLGTSKFVIIPSSVHEMIIMPFDDSIDIEEVNQMVAEVNRTQVSPEDRLTDRAYVIEL